MSEYVTISLDFSERNRNIYHKLLGICIDCKEQTQGRVCKNFKITAAKAVVTENATRIRKLCGSKKFLDKVCGGNCGELVVQYASSEKVSDYDSSNIIIKKRDGRFLAVSSDLISQLHTYYNITSSNYERAKKNAGFFQSMKAAALGSNVREFGGEYFDEQARKILKIIVDSKTVDEKLKSLEEYFAFKKSQESYFRYGNFNDLNQADQFIRNNVFPKPIYVETAVGYDLSSVSVPMMRIVVTFKYNETFYKQIKTFIDSGFVENRQECLKALEQLDVPISSSGYGARSAPTQSMSLSDAEAQLIKSIKEQILAIVIKDTEKLIQPLLRFSQDFDAIFANLDSSRAKDLQDTQNGMFAIRRAATAMLQPPIGNRINTEITPCQDLREEIDLSLKAIIDVFNGLNNFGDNLSEMSARYTGQSKVTFLTDSCKFLEAIDDTIKNFFKIIQAINETFTAEADEIESRV